MPQTLAPSKARTEVRGVNQTSASRIRTESAQWVLHALINAVIVVGLLGGCSDSRMNAMAQPPMPAVSRVVLVILENQDYEKVILHPVFADLAKRGVHFTNSHGRIHPSYCNYIALVAGQVPNKLLPNCENISQISSMFRRSPTGSR